MIFNWYDTGSIEPYVGKVEDSSQKVLPLQSVLDSLKEPPILRDEESPGPSTTPLKQRISEAQSAYLQQESQRGPREPAILAEQIMTHPVHVAHPSWSLHEAIVFMQHHNIRHLPVMDLSGHLVGMLSEKDILKKTHPAYIETQQPMDVDSHYVAQIMNRPVLTATPRSEIRILTRILFQERMGAMPIVNYEQRLAGIVTTIDIFRTVMNREPLALWL